MLILDLLDPEAELHNFVEKRAREREDANEIDKFWAEQERQHRERRREETCAA